MVLDFTLKKKEKRKKNRSKINKVYTLNMGQNYAKKLWEKKSISGCVF